MFLHIGRVCKQNVKGAAIVFVRTHYSKVKEPAYKELPVIRNILLFPNLYQEKT